MSFPMSMSDIGLWLAVMAIILLISSELISSATEYSRNIIIERNRLRLVALALGTGFMATVVMRIFQPF
jgi:heme/copper-type cytochrome/quinol oxidase subunit 3